MAEKQKLKVFALGGLDEIGKNVYVYEFGGDILVVDCGMGFPDGDMLGVDLVIPDISYLKRHKNRIKGIVITHGHEDHIGSVPYVLRDINPPIYATPLTIGLIQNKLEEVGLLKQAKLNTVNAGDTLKLGQFKVELINVNHSIPDAVALAITTPLGTVIHTGDFKIDPTPVSGKMIDLARLGELGNAGVLALFSDSTNVERPGYTISESKVGDALDAQFKGCSKRLIITTFASNVHRIQQIVDSAVKYNRKVAISGRSMENILKIATRLGYIRIPEGTLVDIAQAKSVSRGRLVIVTTGSQGETMSALNRMAFGTHKQIEIGAGDKVIISASPIPGNEKTISRVINELFRRGAEVVYEKLHELHVSGHACREELKLMLALVKPKYFMPVHGERRHLSMHAALAREMGVEPKHVFLGETGRVLEITKTSARLAGSVATGQVLIDGSRLGDVGSVVLRDRRMLSEDGIIIVVVTLSSETNAIVAGPEILSRGFVYIKEADELMDRLQTIARDAIEQATKKKNPDWASIKQMVKNKISDHLFKKTKRSPMVLPVIMEVQP